MRRLSETVENGLIWFSPPGHVNTTDKNKFTKLFLINVIMLKWLHKHTEDGGRDNFGFFCLKFTFRALY